MSVSVNKKIKIDLHPKRRGFPKHLFSYKKYKSGASVYYTKGGIIETRVYKMVLRLFRKISRRRKYSLFFFFKPNFILTRKPKSSRMGKGKGKYLRKAIYLKTNKVFMISYKISYKRLIFFFSKLKKITGYTFVVKKNNFTYLV